MLNKETFDRLTSIKASLAGSKLTIATAESCTSGLLGYLLTVLSGSSSYYLGGVVSYANSAKIELLGIDAEIIESFGAVSHNTAEAMAAGVAKRLGATCGISLTGIAGPGGGSADKPVGTVYQGLYFEGETTSRLMQLDGDREAIRWQAAQKTIEHLDEILGRKR